MMLVPLCIALIAASRAVVGFYLPGLAPVTYCETPQDNCKVERRVENVLFHKYCSTVVRCILFVFVL